MQNALRFVMQIYCTRSTALRAELIDAQHSCICCCSTDKPTHKKPSDCYPEELRCTRFRSLSLSLFVCAHAMPQTFLLYLPQAHNGKISRPFWTQQLSGAFGPPANSMFFPSAFSLSFPFLFFFLPYLLSP